MIDPTIGLVLDPGIGTTAEAKPAGLFGD